MIQGTGHTVMIAMERTFHSRRAELPRNKDKL